MAVLVLALWLLHLAGGELVVYPHPSGATASSKFRVYLRQGQAAKRESFTYISFSDHRVGQLGAEEVRPHRTVSWTSFAFTGNPVTVEVHTATDFHRCIVRPRHYGFHCRRTQAKTAQFTVNSNTRYMSMEFDYDYGSSHADITDKLLIFADPPETSPPTRGNATTLHYGPGFHNLGGPKILDEQVTEVYIAAGAYIQGGFITSGHQSIRIHGRGIISGQNFIFRDPRFHWALVDMDNGSHHTVEGVTLVDPTKFYFRSNGSNNVIRNVKMLVCWTFNTDGVALGMNGLVEDTFIMANDDSLKVYRHNLVVRRCVVWQCQNGAVFQLGWWTVRNLQNVHISDVDVIHTDWCSFKGGNCHLSSNNAVLDLGGSTARLAVSDVEIANVRVEGSCPRIVNFQIPPQATGSVSNVRLINWTIVSQDSTDRLHNQIAGTSGDPISNWHFQNLRVGGQCIGNAYQGDFIIGHVNTQVSFGCSPGVIVG